LILLKLPKIWAWEAWAEWVEEWVVWVVWAAEVECPQEVKVGLEAVFND
jgi:hypothetical protein